MSNFAVCVSPPNPLSLKPGDDRRVMVGGFSRQLLSEVRPVPGVTSAAVFSGEPILQNVAYLSRMLPFFIEGSEARKAVALVRAIYDSAASGEPVRPDGT